MKLLKSIGLFFVLASVFISCSDEEPDTVGPEIQITNIIDNQEFKFGENLVMRFKFTDQTGMYEYKYELYAKDYTTKSYDYENHIIYDTYFTERNDVQSILLPEKTPTEIYQEGEYVIKVQASDVNQRISTYYKYINIYYPEVAE